MTTITITPITIRQLLSRDYGPDLERAGRGLAIAIAFTYACGYAFGSWLHQTNHQLSRFAAPSEALPLARKPQAPAAAEPAVVKRTKRSKLPQPAPKPSRQRRPKNASRTSAPAAA